MKACSFTSVRSSRVMHGLVLEAVHEGAARAADGSGAAGRGRWFLAQEAKGGHVSLLRLRGEGDLELRAVRIVGQRELVVIRELARDPVGAPLRGTHHAVIARMR